MTEDGHKKRVAFARSCKETSARMFRKKKLRSTWTEHPSHIREFLLIKRGPCSWMHCKGSEGGNWRESLKAYSRYILWQGSDLL